MDDGLDDLSQEEQSAIRDVLERVDVDRIAEATGVSRRQALQVIAATGVGIAVGGVGTNALVGNAQAAASTSDSDGNVGLPSNRVDVFADGVDSNSLSTDAVGNDGSPVTLNDPLSAGEGDPTFDFWNLTLTDTEKTAANPNLNDFDGLLQIYDGVRNIAAVVWFDSNQDAVTLLINYGSNISTTEGTSDSTNIYWDSTNNRYEIENQEGEEVTYYIFGFYDAV